MPTAAITSPMIIRTFPKPDKGVMVQMRDRIRFQVSADFRCQEKETQELKPESRFQLETPGL